MAYGKYLVTIAGCANCHTPIDSKGRRIPGQELAGGWLMPGPWGRVVSANLTPDPDNYMGQASREEFIDRFKSLEHLDGENAPIAPPGKNTVMAWPRFAGMTREDLGAIYDYLKTRQAHQEEGRGVSGCAGRHDLTAGGGPDVVKAVRVHAPGGPEVLRYEDVPDPEPAAGQALVRVEAAGVNFIDVYHRTGLYKAALPLTLGQEGAGTVARGRARRDRRAPGRPRRLGRRVRRLCGEGGRAGRAARPAFPTA